MRKMTKHFPHIGNMLARRILKFSDGWAAQHWHNYPFGQKPMGPKEVYLNLWEEEKKNVYPAIDQYENEVGEAIDQAWFHELALHTQIVLKTSKLCYQHGRVLYTALCQYLKEHDEPNLTIMETGTARGFSATVMAYALAKKNRCGKIITFDILPHQKAMYWNCIDDHEKAKTRSELLSPWKDFVTPHVFFVEGDSRINLSKIVVERCHFAFLDGAHTYHDVFFEFEKVAQLQCKNDVIVFDDYNSTDFPGLVRAVDTGCERWGYQKKVIQGGEHRSYVVAKKMSEG